MRTRFLFLVGGVALVAASVAAQNTWYVDAWAAAPGSGTQASPWTSLQYAIDAPATVSGDTLLVAPRTYEENVDFGSKELVVRATMGPYLTQIRAASPASTVRIHGGQSPATVLEGFTITGGSAFVGGGLSIESSSPTIRGCIVRGNTAMSRGGGVWVAYDSPRIERCVIAGNTVTGVTGRGGGLYSMYGFQMTIEQCTITANVASDGAGFFNEFSVAGASLRNSIVRGNTGSELVLYQSQLAVAWCDIGGGFPGTGIVDVDPLFWNRFAHDYALGANSPCIDAGDPAILDPNGTITDLGAIPFDPLYVYNSPQNYPNSFCYADGIDPLVAIPCPCGNAGPPGHGCASSTNPNGGVLVASGNTWTDDVVLHGYGMPATSTCIHVKGNLMAIGGTPVGDGILCTGGTLIRLRTKTNVAGASSFPEAGVDTITLSARGGTVPGSGIFATYQVYYRNAAAAFCPPATFNVTSGWQLYW